MDLSASPSSSSSQRGARREIFHGQSPPHWRQAAGRIDRHFSASLPLVKMLVVSPVNYLFSSAEGSVLLVLLNHLTESDTRQRTRPERRESSWSCCLLTLGVLGYSTFRERFLLALVKIHRFKLLRLRVIRRPKEDREKTKYA